jgi:hypothetical protein
VNFSISDAGEETATAKIVKKGMIVEKEKKKSWLALRSR